MRRKLFNMNELKFKVTQAGILIAVVHYARLARVEREGRVGFNHGICLFCIFSLNVFAAYFIYFLFNTFNKCAIQQIIYLPIQWTLE